MRAWRIVCRALAEVVAPARCLGCLREGVWLCADCRDKRKNFEQACIVCRRKSVRGLTHDACQQKTALTGHLAAGAYHDPALRRGVHWLKFKSVRAVAPALASLVIPYLNTIAPLAQLRIEAELVPIPLHRRRESARGFNQSEVLAQSIATITGLPVRDRLLRCRATWAQARLPEKLRQENLAGALTLAPEATMVGALAQTLILIDDVATSGSTLTAAARVLKDHGAGSIWAVTIARG